MVNKKIDTHSVRVTQSIKLQGSIIRFVLRRTPRPYTNGVGASQIEFVRIRSIRRRYKIEIRLRRR